MTVASLDDGPFPERARRLGQLSRLGGRRVSEWLLTTDHKRIALLYAVMVTAFFFIGGAAATLIRLELFSPTPASFDRRRL